MSAINGIINQLNTEEDMVKKQINRRRARVRLEETFQQIFYGLLLLVGFAVWKTPRLGNYLLKEVPHIAIPAVVITWLVLRLFHGKLESQVLDAEHALD